MIHLGDITKIHGDQIEPVDCITFGSPCQDLSMAGLRAGLEGKNSGLFTEAIRVIVEMRVATNGMYPAFAIWENVPGAFSSNGGEDFRTVLEKLAHAAQPDVSIPRPAGGRWCKAGAIIGNGWSLAWRLLNAERWGVPSVESVSQLSQILEVNVPQRYFLSARACQGILTRASRRGKALPDLLKTALLDMIEWWQGRQPTP